MSTSPTTTAITQSIFDAQDQALSLLKQGSESTAKALESWTDFVAEQVKAVVPAEMATDTWAPALEAVPTPTKAVETSFTFIEQMVAQQRELATRVLEGAEELLAAGTGTAGEKKTASK